MLELVMGASHPNQKPSIRFQLLDELLAVYGGYYDHFNGCGNALLPSYPNNEQVTPITRPGKMRIRDEFRVSNIPAVSCQNRLRGLPGSAQETSTQASGLRLRGTATGLAI
jgi:hypothetical protein